jgi:hypothetical protein
MYQLEILLKDAQDATKLPPQHIMEHTAELVAVVIAEQLGESHVYYGDRLGGDVDTNGDIEVDRMGIVWAMFDADALEAVFTPVHEVAACIAEALEQFTVSFMVVDVAEGLYCTPRPQQVALTA